MCKLASVVSSSCANCRPPSCVLPTASNCKSGVCAKTCSEGNANLSVAEAMGGSGALECKSAINREMDVSHYMQVSLHRHIYPRTISKL